MMSREHGSPDERVWLLGDSEPDDWRDKLEFPLDSRHPARHSIWTPVLNSAQRRLYTLGKLRFDDAAIYVRNAVGLSAHRPSRAEREWAGPVQGELSEFSRITEEHRPLIIFTFGAFACEFAFRSVRGAKSGRENRPFRSWSTKALGSEFIEACRNFDASAINIVPMLHATIARNHFLASHRDFCGGVEDANYFEFAGTKIADLLLRGRGQGIQFL